MITPTIEVIPGPVTRVWEEQNYAHLLSKEEEEKLLKTNLEGLPETYEIKVLENKIETLYKYFQELPGDVNEYLEILGHIVEAGMDAGGDGANMKGGSYQYLMAAIALAKKYTTNIPNPEDFTYSVYKVRNGWGCAVYKHEIEEKLGISL
ncbi:MAG: hypothetical protein JST49_07335 [Bacteroidetes bacterium]|nr:hypothetical protein [Bacteroidota bacterium]